MTRNDKLLIKWRAKAKELKRHQRKLDKENNKYKVELDEYKAKLKYYEKFESLFKTWHDQLNDPMAAMLRSRDFINEEQND